MGNTASLVKNIVTQKKYKEKYHWTDYFSYFYLFLGVFLMFGPIIWLGLSSVKTLAGIQELYVPRPVPNVPGQSSKTLYESLFLSSLHQVWFLPGTVE